MRRYVLVVKGTGDKDCDNPECLGEIVKDIAKILEFNPDNFPDVTPVHGTIMHYRPPNETYCTVIEFFEESGQLPDGRSAEPHPLLDNKDEIKNRLTSNGYQIIDEYHKER